MIEHILFVDDEKLIKRLVSQYFRNQVYQGKYEFIFAGNGIEALEILKEQPLIKLVVTDINMPEMDGLTLIAKIREFYPNIKTIIVSAYENLKIIRQAMNIGACDFINKPIDFQDLEASIRRTLDDMLLLKQENCLSNSNQVTDKIKYPSDDVVSNIQEAQSVIQDIIQQLQVYQQNLPESSPDILQKALEVNGVDLLVDVSKILKSMNMATERLEQICRQLKTPLTIDNGNTVSS